MLLHPLSWPRRILIGLVQAYRFLLKPWLGSACRFEPTCSAYAMDALRRHGAVRGLALSGWRLARCHPWCDGGLDPVPEYPRRTGDARAGLFTRLAGPVRAGAHDATSSDLS
ncbi:MAG: membrane protein insertion efficiency factor YidD [Burkholderiales bacterium]|nr:membrane protein insertion efficiency factor YidD [Burkholderiales bacterium]